MFVKEPNSRGFLDLWLTYAYWFYSYPTHQM